MNSRQSGVEQETPAARSQAHAALLRRVTGALASIRRSDERCLLLRLQLEGLDQVQDPVLFAAVSRVVAERLQRRVRTEELLARSAPHEFTVVTRGIDVFPPRAGASIAQRLVEALGQPCEVEGVRVQLSLRIGIAGFPDDGRDAESLLLSASRALYGAHRAGEAWRFAARLPGKNG